MNKDLLFGIQHEQAIVLYFSVYIIVFLIGMISKTFRDTFTDWMTLRDALGLRFWARNLWFLIFTFFYLLAGALLAISSGNY